MHTFHPYLAASFIFAVGCGQNVPRQDNPENEEQQHESLTLADRLLLGQSLELSATGQNSSQMSFALSGSLANEPSMALPVAGGHVRVHREDTLWVDAITFFFDDVVVNPRPAFPNGVVITGIEMSMVSAAAADDVVWSDGERVVSATGEFDLVFDWGWTPLDDPNEVHPLPTQQIPGFTFEIVASVDEDDEDMNVGIIAAATGLVWVYNFSSDDSSVELHDPRLTLTAR